MKYYSEILNKMYDSEQDLLNAEENAKAIEYKKREAEKAKKLERATRAKEVEKALKEASEAQAKANKLLRSFTHDYGFFHTTYSIDDVAKEEDNVKEEADGIDSNGCNFYKIDDLSRNDLTPFTIEGLEFLGYKVK